MIIGVLCYIKQNGKILFLHRVKKEHDELLNQWIGLGGKVEKGEFPHESVVREVYEESGLSIIPKFRGVVAFLNEDNNRNDWYAYVYTASDFTGSLKEETREGDLVWIDENEIDTLHLLEGDRILLDLLNEKEFIEAKFVYSGDKLKTHRSY